MFCILKGHVDSVCEATIYLERSIKVSFEKHLRLSSLKQIQYRLVYDFLLYLAKYNSAGQFLFCGWVVSEIGYKLHDWILDRGSFPHGFLSAQYGEN